MLDSEICSSYNFIGSLKRFDPQMALGLMVGAAAFFAVGFFAAGSGQGGLGDQGDQGGLGDGSAKQEMDEKLEQHEDKDEEYDYSWAMQGVNRSRIR